MTSLLYESPGNPVPDHYSGGFLETHDKQQLRYAIFRPTTQTAQGTVILLHGRTACIEKYLETINDLTAKGLWVATFDLRGQGGSTRLRRRPFHGHVKRFTDYERDLELFLHQIVMAQTPGPYFILAHSTGGLIALSAAPRLSDYIERMVLCAPFVGLTGQSASPATIQRLARLACSFGLGSFPLATKRPDIPFTDNPYTSDEIRYERSVAMVKAHPHLALGLPTARWIHEAFKTIKRVTSPQHLFSITIPTLVIAPTKDSVIPFEAQERLFHSFRAGHLIPIHGARHEILDEQDQYRLAALAAFHAFVPGSDVEAVSAA